MPEPPVLVVTGELDMDTVPAWQAQADALLDDARRAGLTIDLAALGFCDSSGLAMFTGLRNRALTENWPFALVNVPRRIRRVMSLGGLDGVFMILDDR